MQSGKGGLVGPFRRGLEELQQAENTTHTHAHTRTHTHTHTQTHTHRSLIANRQLRLSQCQWSRHATTKYTTVCMYDTDANQVMYVLWQLTQQEELLGWAV